MDAREALRICQDIHRTPDWHVVSYPDGDTVDLLEIRHQRKGERGSISTAVFSWSGWIQIKQDMADIEAGYFPGR